MIASIRRASRQLGWLCVLAAAACGSDGSSGSDGSLDGGRDGSAATDGATMRDAAPADGAATSDAAGPDGATPSLVQQLQTVTAACNVASTARYATDQGVTPTVDICRLSGAFFWKADMDIDCDGQSTSACSLMTDPDFQNQTSFNQSDGQPLSAEHLPFVVIPLASARFDYATAGIKPGALVAVLYNGQLQYGVFGDEGPSGIIGEASYAMAQSLGIDPNPRTGGVNTGVTYIVFTGAGAVVSPIESHAAAVTLGGQLAAQLIQSN